MKTPCIIIAFLARIILSPAQPVVVWEREYGGTGEERVNAMKTTPDGGLIAVGYSTSADGDVSGNYGSRDYWVVKLNCFGLLEWERHYGGSSLDEAIDVELTPDNGYIILGSSNSNDGDIKDHTGGTDMWMIKIDATGNLEWSKSVHGRALDLHLLTNQGFILYGSNGIGESLVYRLNGNDREIEWFKVIKTNILFETKGSVAQNALGELIFACTAAPGIDSTASPTLCPHGNADFWIFTLDASGNLIPNRSPLFGGSENEFVQGMAISRDQNHYILFGSSRSNDGQVGSNVDDADAWAIKVNNRCDSIVWRFPKGYNSDDTFYSGLELEDGAIMTWASQVSNVGKLFRINSLGELLWEFPEAGSYLKGYSKAIVECSAGSYVVASISNSHRNFHFTALSKYCLPDTSLVKPKIYGDSIICENSILVLKTGTYFGPSVQYYWNTPSGLIVTPEPRLDYNVPALPDSLLLFSVLAGVAGCPTPVSDTHQVSIGPQPVLRAHAQEDNLLCGTDQIQLTAEAPVGPVIGAWTSFGAGNLHSPFAASTLVTELDPGLNFFRWALSAAHCPEYDADSVAVLVESMPEAKDAIIPRGIDTDTIYFDLSQINNLQGTRQPVFTLASLPGFGAAILEDSGSLGITGLKFRDESLLFSYRICSTDCPNLCDTAHIAVVQTERFNLNIPEGITPNGDGTNDFLIIDGLTENYPDHKLSIYNRWGQLVFDAQPYQNTFDGNDMPAGTYYYILNLGGEASSVTGIIHLFK